MHSRKMIPAILGLALIMVLAGAGLAIQRASSPDLSAGSNGMFRAVGLRQPSGPPQASAGTKLSTPTANGIVVGTDYKHDVSAPLRDLPPLPFGFGTRADEGKENRSLPLVGHTDGTDPVVQRIMGPLVMPAPIVSFEGIDVANGCGGCMPPDTNGEVGPNHYVQMVNSAVQIWNKSGTPAGPAVAISTLWTGFGGPCSIRNDGDPIVMYDQLADRWLISQFTAATPYNECIAVSTTGDPTGTYNRYAFQLSTTDFEDYPHFGVWPDGYYMSANQFDNGSTYAGPRPYVFDRARMLQGLTATFQTTANALGNTAAGFLPADLDGSASPPAGAPNYFLGFGSPMPFYQFHVDWATPANTTFTNPTNVANAAFTQLCPSTQNCVPQPGTAVGLDGLADRGMFRLAYRNFGTHQSLVGNFSVDVGGGQAGVRWYEIRNPGAGATLFQEGTYAPDATSRWMASLAMDHDGNLAVGYSASSASVFPSIRYAGRLSGDPLGQLTQGEANLFTGIGSQTGGNRWGDYSDMTVDPTDDCTFWYTNEYNGSTGNTTWRTRIGSFKFPNCGGVQGTPTPVPPSVTPGGPPTPCAITFADVDQSNTFYTFIRCLACRGIVGGYPCGGPNEPCPGTYYRPNNNVTRGQVSKIVSESAQFSDPVPSTQQTFEDVAPGSTFALWVERLSTRGIIGGYPCGGPFEPCVAPDNRPYFRPNNNVTRGQLSKIVSGAAGYTETPTVQTFEDVAVGSTFYVYVERMASRAIIGGYPCGGAFEPCVAPDNRPYFRPNNNATRAQLAKIAANTFFPNCQTPAR